MSRSADPREPASSRRPIEERAKGGGSAGGEQRVDPGSLPRPARVSPLPDPRPHEPAEPRVVHELRGRSYRLRQSEIQAMREIGVFRVIAQEDLVRFFYRGDEARYGPDAENLLRQGLVQLKTIPQEEAGSRTLLALTKQGHRFLKASQAAPGDQTLYHGFTKPREAHHDADLYRLYQKASEEIARSGGERLRVVLDYEFKKRVYHDLAKLGEDRHSPAQKRAVAEQHHLRMVRGKIPVPDLRIEYETRGGEKAHVDLELATGHYRGRNLAEKARAGFSIYARAEDRAKLRRILDERELTAEILSL